MIKTEWEEDQKKSSAVALLFFPQESGYGRVQRLTETLN